MSEINNKQNSENYEAVRKKQFRNLFYLILVAVAICGFLFFAFSNKSKPVSTEASSNFVSPIKNLDLESVLISKTEARLEVTEKNSEELKKKFSELVLENKNQSNQQEALQKELETVKTLNKRLEDLEHKFENETHSHNTNAPNFNGTMFPNPTNASGVAEPQTLMTQGIRDDVISLAPDPHAQTVPLKNPETYVPAGTFVKAVALGGADASAAVNAQANPTPMLFRIIENGTMPNNKKSLLKGCLATAAVVGDISSERGMIRLETLSCIDPDSARIVDIAVEGTVFGPEGKNGLRGIPMWREGALLQRAFTAGALSGLAGGISQKYVTNSISPLGKTETISGSDIFKYGAASGASSAMERLADYNIQRAEQYHPVLQLSAGTTVNLVFLKGFYLDGLKHDEAKEDNVNIDPKVLPENNNNANSISNLPKLPFTPEQVSRLKAHEAELNS